MKFFRFSTFRVPLMPAALLLLAFASARAHAALPHYDHIVVVIEENHSYSQILGDDNSASYLKTLAAGGASFTQSYSIRHPSEPNYLALFSGSTQGMIDDSVPRGTPFTVPNLGAELFAKGFTFIGFSQGLPYLGFDGKSFSTNHHQNQYERKHNPWVNWQNAKPGTNQLPPWTNLPFFGAFPSQPGNDFSVLPTVAFVVPDEQHDMHDGSIYDADAWLQNHLSSYAEWAKSHNSLLIVTFDEDNGSVKNQIPTIFYGAHIKPGNYSEKINHYSVLRTIEDIYGLDHAGESANATPVTDIFIDN